MFLSGFWDVEVRSNSVLGLCFRHGKSPWFSRCVLFSAVDVDYGSSGFAVFNMTVIQECAFLNGN
jgi:hypothetical protein